MNCGANLDAIPNWCITVGMKEIFRAKKVRMCMPRDWNAAALRKVLHGPVTASVPCSLFQNHPDAMLYAAAVALHELRFDLPCNPGQFLVKRGQLRRAVLLLLFAHGTDLIVFFLGFARGPARLLVFLRRQLGRIAAARQRTGDGDGVHLIGSLVSGQPVANIGAGRRGLSFIGAQGRGHAHRIQRAVIVIFLVIGDDLQGHTGKIHAIQCIQACGRIHNDPGLHKQYLHSSGKIRRIFSCCRSYDISFSKTCQQFLRNLQKVFIRRLTLSEKYAILSA